MRSGYDRRRFLLGAATVGAGTVVGAPGEAVADTGTAPREPDGTTTRVLLNNVGFDPGAPKRVVVTASSPPGGFRLIDTTTGETVLSGPFVDAGRVADWDDRRYWTADFSRVERPGDYFVAVGSARSAPFKIEPTVLERYTLSHVVHHFKGWRCSGQYDKFDRHVPLGRTGRTYDAHGGWYDATGDFGKHFTQLSPLSYFNTLQLPLTAWSLFVSYRELTARKDENFTQLRTWMQDEGLYGADYIRRVHVPGQSFYSSVRQPGPPKDPLKRTLGTEQVCFREGGGIAIAALAIASTHDVSGDYESAEYLSTAKDAFAYLEANNVRLTNDGKENIQDDYNALLAAVELYRATDDDTYRKSAEKRAASLASRLVTWRDHRDYWRADDKDRPYFHPSDAGLPVVALLTYAGIADGDAKDRVLDTVRRSMLFELSVTAEVTNPFGYARQLVQDGNGNRAAQFFFPHNVTPRARDQWWQGENARIASLATAARLTARAFSDDRTFAAKLRSYAANQLDWILGANPYDVCMLDGSGQNNPQYLWLGSWQFLQTAGGVVNGITGKNEDGSGILWDHGFAKTGKDDDWRWGEQWLPHTSWYMNAVAIG
ncbi:beta-glucosidase (glycosyl hydrolase family 9) [Actinomadura pelletieri DSM 43383]|uniref:Beta-glucosidase (Glycosyl hydrolase family 9) n=1 Tax=Actinomadura pelletieri DSM 43383 TaxID=1120940 RepID=A0A495QTX7_9ACTN|nr:beta-glucosidase (glycosyl hydrolase family 9) [Actinomadura pelletieri DSM 43383]